MKMLSLVIIPWNSGLAAYAFDQALALRAAGHEVIIGSPAGSAADKFAAASNFRHVNVPDHKHFGRFPSGFGRLFFFVRREGVDAIVAHTGLAQTVGWLFRLFSPRLALVRVKADARPPAIGPTFAGVNKVISASAHIEKMYLDAGLEPALSVLIRQAIEVPPYEPPPAPAPFRVGILGRLDPVKGHEVFLRAAALSLKAGPGAEFHIAGEDCNVKRADLERLAAELGIAEKVVFHGRLPDTLAFMRSCHAGVSASLGSEAVSRAALEWMAAGRPLVATSAGSLPEFTEPDLLVAPGDHAAMAGKLAGLAADPLRAEALGRAARERAARDFSREAFVKATAAIFSAAPAGI
ncbi:MAG: group 1 glycosyl transferase [Elusimicrobia bacterium]|nr:MAG: group 1 glycosyl transferase [Elusimicrobiota bacterium]KAF0158220.1 MAG: group 1 glycosyl transferase [Elusimicrobiota bacterium]